MAISDRHFRQEKEEIRGAISIESKELLIIPRDKKDEEDDDLFRVLFFSLFCCELQQQGWKILAQRGGRN